MSLERLRDLAQSVLGLAALLWAANLVLLYLIGQEVTFTVCDGPLLHIPPGSFHWPPRAHNLYLVGLHHTALLSAMGATIIGAFLLLHSSPTVPTRQRLLTLSGCIGASLLAAAVLWLAVQYDLINAHVQALVGCL